MAFMPVKTEARKVHIYEILNRTRLESLLVVTTSDSADIGSRLKREPPPEADGWAPGDDTAVEILAQHMNEAAAELFLKMHLEHMQARTWKFRVWRT
ncbi:MAG: hypothetical protein NDJ72_05340 [Elusimicrobia bacterium]|nr:hypothetical protein [Elusimicrobiota bacterium]